MNTIKIFYAYARRDKLLRDELEKHLEPLKRLGQITTWYDREIQPGKDWKREIENQINTADIILLLLSPNFVSSNYCYGQEMQRALEQQTKGAVHIIPIILRPVTWQELPIGNLQALPTDGKPVSNWRHRDDAFEDIVRGIHQVVIGYQLRKANQESTQYAHSTNSQDQRWNLFTNEFLLRMVHNLRVPLTSLTGYLELVTEFDEQLDPQMRNTFLQSAKRSQEEIELLANWLLELIFLQRQLVLKDFLFAELVHNVIQTTDQKLQEGHPLSEYPRRFSDQDRQRVCSSSTQSFTL